MSVSHNDEHGHNQPPYALLHIPNESSGKDLQFIAWSLLCQVAPSWHNLRHKVSKCFRHIYRIHYSYKIHRIHYSYKILNYFVYFGFFLVSVLSFLKDSDILLFF